MKQRKIALNDFPQYSPWPKRLLGLEQFRPVERTIAKTEQEYNKDKYSVCLKKYEEMKEEISIEEIKRFEVTEKTTETCIAINDELFVTTPAAAFDAYYQFLVEKLKPALPEEGSVVELASGYGYNLWFLREKLKRNDLEWLGGEYSENGVYLGEQLFSGDEHVRIKTFNFYNPPYHILEETRGPLMIFTVYGVQQLPHAQSFLEGLRPYKDRIHRVVNIESVYELYDDSLLGLMQKRYTELCDYNVDLLTLLKAAPDVRIVRIEPNVFGLNPLLPASVIEWEFI